ncbi:MAG: hypothetical protein ACRC2T_11900, partial [Thermoguttaceae bacterium]
MSSYVICAAMLYPFFLTLVYFVVLAKFDPMLQKSTFFFGKIIQFALPVFWIGWILREKWMLRKFSWRGVPEGIVFGAAVFVV